MAQGGPPLLTDDPGTPGNGQWEINFLATVEYSRDGSVFEAPLIDINYGLGDHLQLKFEAPWVTTKEPDLLRKSGLGNSMIGLKWRFLDRERHGVDMSIYPQLEFNNPTASVARGLADRGMRLLLPVELVKRVGPVDLNGEIGYRIVRRGLDELEYGLAVSRQLAPRFALLAEVHGSALRTFRADELVINAGSRWRVGRNAALLFSAGRTIRQPNGEAPHFLGTVGLQVTFSNRVFTSP
jgi:hypothetical protein